MSENEMDMQEDYILGEDEDGNEVQLKLVHTFFYQGEEYGVLTDATEEDEEEDEIGCFIMKIVPAKDEDGEEYEDFLPIEDEALEEKLMDIANTQLNEEEADEE